MANRFTRWAPTAYVPLPIDYYTQALAQKEQKTAAELEKITAMLSAYSSVDPLGKNAEALYDQTMGKLRKEVEEAAKQNLDTPAGIRSIKKIVSNPEYAGTLSKIYKHSIEGAKKMAEMNEYRKDNPEVNTYKYGEAFAKLANEQGEADKFNPNLFSSLGPISKYQDLEKMMADGIKDLHADVTEWKRIAEPYMIAGKETELSKQKVRDYVMGQLKKNPIVKEQLMHNINYAGFQASPADIDAGLEMVGKGYIEHSKTMQKNAQDMLTRLYTKPDGKIMTQAEIDKKLAGTSPGDSNFREQKIEIDQLLEVLGEYKQPKQKPTDPDAFVDPITAAAMGIKNEFRYGFDSKAFKDTKSEQEYSPKYLIGYRADRALGNALALKKLQDQQDMTSAVSMGYDTREISEVTPSGYGDYFKKKIPELAGLLIDSNGAMTAENYMSRLQKIDGKYYNPSDVEMVTYKMTQDPKEKARREAEGWTTGTQKDWAHGASVPYYIKKGAKPVPYTAEGAKALYDADVAKIEAYMKKHSISNNYDLKTGDGVRTALNHIVNYNRDTETQYEMYYSDASSTSPDHKARLKAGINSSTIYKRGSDGQMVAITDKTELQNAKDAINEELKNPLSSVMRKPVTTLGRPLEMIAGKDKNYYIDATPTYTTVAAPANALFQEATKDGNPVRSLSNGSLSIKSMGADGRLQLLNIPYGATKPAQDMMATNYELNVNKVMKAGDMTRAEAEAAIQNRESTMDSGSDTTFTIPLKGGKSITIDVPVFKTPYKDKDNKEYYYVRSQAGPLKPLNGFDMLQGVIQQYSRPTNSEWVLENLSNMRSATVEKTAFTQSLINSVLNQ